jgi:hypothetical protein
MIIKIASLKKYQASPFFDIVKFNHTNFAVDELKFRNHTIESTLLFASEKQDDQRSPLIFYVLYNIFDEKVVNFWKFMENS